MDSWQLSASTIDDREPLVAIGNQKTLQMQEPEKIEAGQLDLDLDGICTAPPLALNGLSRQAKASRPSAVRPSIPAKPRARKRPDRV